FNDWWRDGAAMPTWMIVLGGVFAGILGYSIAGGRWPRRLAIALGAAAAGVGLFVYISESAWLVDPEIGLPILIPLALGIAIAATAVFAGIANKRALGATLTTAAIGIVLYLPLQPYFD